MHMQEYTRNKPMLMPGVRSGMIVRVMSKRIILFLTGLLLVLVNLVPRQSAAQSAPDQRFGMTEVFWLPDEARELGVGWERILFYWREIQPQGPEDWNTLHVLEEWLVEAKTRGREVVGLIKNTPPWASIDGSEAGLPKGLDLPLDDPDNLWANYVGRLADYYGQRGVHHWIIWNEPEIAQGVYGFEFAGSAADYYQMLKTAYMVMKQRDPQAVIHLAGLTWWHDPSFLDRLLAIAAADPDSVANGYFFDVISLHIYFRTETVKSIVEDVDAIQRRYGLEKPIWINETNAPPNRDPEWPVERPRFNIDLDQQAWFIVQAMALGFASGAERVSVYKMLDIQLPPGGESFGVLRPDQSRRPAYDAYKMATRCFGGFERVRLEEDPLFYHVIFERQGSLTHVAWSRTAAESVVTINARAQNGAVMGFSGGWSAVTPENGSYSLALPGQRCDGECLVGGEPRLLVETTGDEAYSQSCLNYRTAGMPGAILEDSVATAVPTGGAQHSSASATPETTVNAGGQGEPQLVSPTLPQAAVATSEHSTESDADLSLRQQPTVTRPGTGVLLAEPTPVGDNSAADSDGVQGSGGGTIGLWFIGVGAGLVLLMAYFSVRTRARRAP
jgi:hypothetical protein